MHYHVTENPDFQGAKNLQWYTDRFFYIMPEVSQAELARSRPDCVTQYGLLVVKPSGNSTVETLVNNNGRRREFTPRQLVDFLITCSQKGDSVSIDETLADTYVGGVIEKEIAANFGEDGYTITSARTPDANYIRSISIRPQAQATQQPVLA